ncbi:hypothetical protein V8G54_004020 [Vigna mungo]|uniref:Uncharacterized protein n=1 Tax=Vigna mungo TaxID=3915 RepID=A0AAQ3PCS5_VIGMU
MIVFIIIIIIIIIDLFIIIIIIIINSRRGILENEESVLVDKTEKMMKEETNKRLKTEKIEALTSEGNCNFGGHSIGVKEGGVMRRNKSNFEVVKRVATRLPKFPSPRIIKEELHPNIFYFKATTHSRFWVETTKRNSQDAAFSVRQLANGECVTTEKGKEEDDKDIRKNNRMCRKREKQEVPEEKKEKRKTISETECREEFAWRGDLMSRKLNRLTFDFLPSSLVNIINYRHIYVASPRTPTSKLKNFLSFRLPDRP